MNRQAVHRLADLPPGRAYLWPMGVLDSALVELAAERES